MHARKRRGIAARTGLSFAVLTGAQAWSAERWIAVDGEAAAVLPEPTRTKTIESAKLECAEQRWNLAVTLLPEAIDIDGARQAEMAIGSDRFDLDAERTGSGIAVSVPTEALPPLRSGIRMNLSISGGKSRHRARFSLIGSRRAIDAIAPRCSQRDMSAYVAIIPSELSPETVLARELLADEIKAFQTATKSQPVLAAALKSVDDNRRLLFATLCGSSWYYGNSGCNMTVHAQSDDDGWQRVYETEGVKMHIDPNADSEGWPDLVALTFDGDEIVWRWMKGIYEPPIAEELRGG